MTATLGDLKALVAAINGGHEAETAADERRDLTPAQQQRQAAALTIDPATAALLWDYADMGDPYGDDPRPYEDICVGRAYFAQAPNGLWIDLADIPEPARTILWQRFYDAWPD